MQDQFLLRSLQCGLLRRRVERCCVFWPLRCDNVTTFGIKRNPDSGNASEAGLCNDCFERPPTAITLVRGHVDRSYLEIRFLSVNVEECGASMEISNMKLTCDGSERATLGSPNCNTRYSTASVRTESRLHLCQTSRSAEPVTASDPGGRKQIRLTLIRHATLTKKLLVPKFDTCMSSVNAKPRSE